MRSKNLPELPEPQHSGHCPHRFIRDAPGPPTKTLLPVSLIQTLKQGPLCSSAHSSHCPSRVSSGPGMTGQAWRVPLCTPGSSHESLPAAEAARKLGFPGVPCLAPQWWRRLTGVTNSLRNLSQAGQSGGQSGLVPFPSRVALCSGPRLDQSPQHHVPFLITPPSV